MMLLMIDGSSTECYKPQHAIQAIAVPLAETKMRKSIAIVLTVFFLFALKTQSQEDEPLKLVQTIPLPGLHDGDFDHFAVDVPGQRLFLAAEENSAVEVIDLRFNKLIHTIAGPKTPHSMAYNAESKKLFVADDGGPSQVEIFDGTSYKLLGTIPMEAHADASIYDPVSKLYYVGNDIKIDADRVEAMALEKSGPRLFVNLTSKNAIAVIDREKRAVIETWSIADVGRGNAPMAFDENDHRLFVVARETGNLVVVNTDSGKIVTTLLLVGQHFSDDAVYDARYKRVYVSGVPFLDVYQKGNEGDRYSFLGQVPGAFHALTSILVPQLNRYYVAVNHHGNTDAMVKVYEVVP
jgi:DNA-binding beta-propeller fold protein YncE